ncbi:hypothetical protein FMN63_11370 [Stappia sp. BW2]|uniref:hypothetical protein n=1 Tax=Stappia sp. BW2 TaxID=2592622 RepID=UPI0011DEB1A8|nr:hypothetical protein [Stappia sp. BW2]TYC68276.1 hypothetical protein FMN63_11370 [Stappia sp. BW2]
MFVRKFVLALLGFLVGGLFIGSTLGVAGFGSAVNGWVVFGPIGAAIGWFFASSHEGEWGYRKLLSLLSFINREKD